MANIFVSCPSSDLDLACEVMHACTDAGHVVTFDWVPFARQADTLTDAEVRSVAKMLYKGHRAADCILLVIPPSGPSFGCGVELGLAWGSGKPVFIAELGSDQHHPQWAIWMAHPFRVAHLQYCSSSLEGALKRITEREYISDWASSKSPQPYLIPDHKHR